VETGCSLAETFKEKLCLKKEGYFASDDDDDDDDSDDDEEEKDEEYSLDIVNALG
jgi:hypothetical protein